MCIKFGLNKIVIANISGGPEIYTENRTIVAHEGDDTKLSAEFCSNPMVNKVFWLASDRVIRPGTAVGPITAHSITVSKMYIYISRNNLNFKHKT